MPIDDMSAAHLAGQAGAFEPQRQNNAVLTIDGIMPKEISGGRGIKDGIALALDSFPIPKTAIEPVQLRHLNEQRNLATSASAEDLNVVYKDFVDIPVHQALVGWFHQTYDPYTGAIGLAGNYKKEGTVTLYGPNGGFDREYRCLGIWINNFDPGDADMASGDKMLINLGLAIDKAVPAKGLVDGATSVSPPMLVRNSNSYLYVDKSTPAGSQYPGEARVYFTWFPDSFNTTVTPNWEDVQVLGRSEGFKIYANTSNKEVSVQFEFFAQEAGNPDDVVEREVLSNVRFLESLAYPVELGNGLVAEPAVCTLKLGSFLKSRVIMTGPPSVAYMGPYTVGSELPMHATVDCTFTEVNEIPKQVSNVLSRVGA